ncbi:MAG: hypothetical protein IJI75_00850 [Solobacterium sp.]|nr:hypothetical protein [Solobacterium sp.]
MLKIHQIKCPIGKTAGPDEIAAKLRCSSSDILSHEIYRQSLDARGDELLWSYTVFAEVRNEQKYLRLKDVEEGHRYTYVCPEAPLHARRPVVVGFGPSGMFAGLILAESGMKPIILERGKMVEQRSEDVKTFFQGGELDPESNVQYGEGGAGTFSDGKLTSRSKDPRVQKVLEEFVEAGADPAIMYRHMPHLGTDQLQSIVRRIREKIISLGGQVFFNTRMTSLDIKDGQLRGVNTQMGLFETDAVILCLGHSAYETWKTLFDQGFMISQKDFAAGVRVEHPQKLIDRNQYGTYAGHPDLGAASYRLTHRSSSGRGVYSFCMCPGGMVIPASTEAGALAVNGMSESSRSGENANSAILVQVRTSDFDRGHALDGFLYQQKLEQNAYRTGFRAPSQNIRDYLEHCVSEQPVIASTYPRGVIPTDMHTLFTDDMNAAMEEGFVFFEHKIPGFISRGIMTGMESRSSSPIRMERDDSGQCPAYEGVFPCGEGAGYAGGIVSSAIDGIRQAEKLIMYLGRKPVQRY